MDRMKLFFIFLLAAAVFSPGFFRASAAEIMPDRIEIVKARVLAITDSETAPVPGMNIESQRQTVTARILEGSKKDETVTFDNDYVQLEQGDLFYLNHTVQSGDGLEFFSVQDAYRLPVIYFFVALFVIMVIFVGGKQGIRGLVSLALSIFLIVSMLLPLILKGFSPILVSIAVSSLIIVVGSYVTHGFNRTTTSAVFGMIITVVVTGIMAYAAVHAAGFSGYASEESTYLNLNSRGQIDLVGILIGGIMIGLLGILYDVAIGQAIAVEELHAIAPHAEGKKVFARAMRMGREHIGALVNTLAIAYVGASLPLLLLFSTPPVEIGMTVNKEIFAVEILRALIGSIGLVMAVPITTALATLMLVKAKKAGNSLELQSENEALDRYAHQHE